MSLGDIRPLEPGDNMADPTWNPHRFFGEMVYPVRALRFMASVGILRGCATVSSYGFRCRVHVTDRGCVEVMN